MRHGNPTKQIVAALLLLVVGMMARIPARGAARGDGALADEAVANEALKIVAGIHSSWSKMPGNIVTGHMTGGALIGNGSVGVAIGGTSDQQEFYLGRDDFWSILRGRIMPVGRLELTIPALLGATSQLQENIAPAEVTGNFEQGRHALKYRTWVAARRNILVLELQNPGTTGLTISADLLDAFGQKDQRTLRGTSGGVYWLRASPEVVMATIGGSGPDGVAAKDIRIRSLEIFDDYLSNAATHSARKPVYSWKSQAALAGDSEGSPTAGAPDVFKCGDIIMPQRRFTVRAFINTGDEGGGAIFSALVGHRWFRQGTERPDLFGNVRGHDVPRVQGASAGLIVYLSQGRLSANLNGTVVTANRPVPAHQWVYCSVAYDGMKMILSVDGERVGETDDFPTAAQVMGPEWQWAAAHPGNPKIPFDGSAPEGILAMRVIGAQASEHEGDLSFVVPAGGRVTLMVAAMDDRDTPQYFHAAISGLEGATAANVAAAWQRHLEWWREFWSKSFIEIPDKTIQSWWYGSLYVLASCSKSGNVAPGLWGNWITSTNMGWQGDYTLDYNYQAPFWAAFPTNHVSLADPYDAPLLAWMDRGRGLAKELHAHGLVYYCHLAPSPGWSADNFRSLDQKSDALFAAVNFIQRWRYTQDAAYARKVWPFLTGVADFWDHDLKLIDGRYVDVEDAADEHLWGPANDENVATTIGFLQMLYPALIQMSYQLHQGQEMRATWRDIVSHLSGLPIAPANTVDAITKTFGANIPDTTKVILQSEKGMQWVSMGFGFGFGFGSRAASRFSASAPVRVSGSSAGMNSMQVVFPAWDIGLESSADLRQAAQNTVKYMQIWYDSNDTSSFYPAAAGVGYDPESILNHLHLLVTHIGFPNFAYNIGAGGVENEATVPTTICAMLLQSYQKNIHVFADWPNNQDASFGDLLACGDFLVSSKISGGKVKYVHITSQRGGLCRLANPWPGQPVQLRLANTKPRRLRGKVLQIPTRAGEHLAFTPLPQ